MLLEEMSVTVVAKLVSLKALGVGTEIVDVQF